MIQNESNALRLKCIGFRVDRLRCVAERGPTQAVRHLLAIARTMSQIIMVMRAMSNSATEFMRSDGVFEEEERQMRRLLWNLRWTWKEEPLSQLLGVSPLSCALRSLTRQLRLQTLQNPSTSASSPIMSATIPSNHALSFKRLGGAHGAQLSSLYSNRIHACSPTTPLFRLSCRQETTRTTKTARNKVLHACIPQCYVASNGLKEQYAFTMVTTLGIEHAHDLCPRDTSTSGAWCNRGDIKVTSMGVAFAASAIF